METGESLADPFGRRPPAVQRLPVGAPRPPTTTSAHQAEADVPPGLYRGASDYRSLPSALTTIDLVDAESADRPTERLRQRRCFRTPPRLVIGRCAHSAVPGRARYPQRRRPAADPRRLLEGRHPPPRAGNKLQCQGDRPEEGRL